MRRHILGIILGLVIVLPLTSFIKPEPQQDINTWGSFVFSVKTITENGTYSPKHVLAIWIKDANGNFVKSLKVSANARKQYLYTWIANTNQNTVDAITSATISSHTTHTVTWNCTNVSGAAVPDGTYKVCIEYTDKHAQGPTAEFSFVKGPNPQSQTPANLTYFQNISLQFTPSPVGFEEIAGRGGLHVFPNPSAGPFYLRWAGDLSEQAELRVYNAAGVIVEQRVVDSATEIIWDGCSNRNPVQEGIYFIEIRDNQGHSYKSRILLMP